MFGIQLPAADTANGSTPVVAAPYYQSEETQIAGNVVVGPSSSAMLFGSNYNAASWNLLPIAGDIRDNRLYIRASARDYVKDAAVAAFYDPLADFAGNVSYLQSAASRGNIVTANSSVIDYVYTASPAIPDPATVTVTDDTYTVSGTQAVKIVDPDTTAAYGATRRFDPIVKGTVE